MRGVGPLVIGGVTNTGPVTSYNVGRNCFCHTVLGCDMTNGAAGGLTSGEIAGD